VVQLRLKPPNMCPPDLDPRILCSDAQPCLEYTNAWEEILCLHVTLNGLLSGFGDNNSQLAEFS
jgi:hypothetical protein